MKLLTRSTLVITAQIVFTFLLSTPLVQADNASNPPPSPGQATSSATSSMQDIKHPCHTVKQACIAAGFEKGEAKEGKGLHENCMHPLVMEGKSIPGITLEASVIQACKARHAEWKLHHKNN